VGFTGSRIAGVDPIRVCAAVCSLEESKLFLQQQSHCRYLAAVVIVYNRVNRAAQRERERERAEYTWWHNTEDDYSGPRDGSSSSCAAACCRLGS